MRKVSVTLSLKSSDNKYCTLHISGRSVKREEWERWPAKRKLVSGPNTGALEVGAGESSPPASRVRRYHALWAALQNTLQPKKHYIAGFCI